MDDGNEEHPIDADVKQFTMSDISNALGMSKEEKTMSRVLLELRRVHAAKIKQVNVRNGKIFQYNYYIEKDDNAAAVDDHFSNQMFHHQLNDNESLIAGGSYSQ